MKGASLRRRPALSGWRTAALAIVGSFSLVQCGGRAEGSTSPSAMDATPDGTAGASGDAAANNAFTDGALTDANTPDAGVDVIVPPAGLCPLRRMAIDSGADASDASDDAQPPPAGGIC